MTDEEPTNNFKEHVWITQEGWTQASYLARDLQRAASLLNKRIDVAIEKGQLAVDLVKSISELMKLCDENIRKLNEQQRLSYQSMIEINKARIESEKTLALRILHLEQAMDRLLSEKYGGKDDV